ncbi:hypothetical protein EDD17DRAFT_1770692 [Pisolithus thermaeus]|nr:hypothetical protein EDD17DRAFT_1770692 [Pisolithus thermaeus]
MAFFRSFFENPAQDESILLESLLSNVRAGPSPVMAMDTAPLDDANADTTCIATPTNTILMDANATPGAIPPNTIPMNADTLLMNAGTMLSAVPANTPSTPAIPTDTMPMEANTSLAAIPTSTIPMDINTILVDAGMRPTPVMLTDDSTLDLSLILTSSNFKELTLGADDDQENVSAYQYIVTGEGGGGGGAGTIVGRDYSLLGILFYFIVFT